MKRGYVLVQTPRAQIVHHKTPSERLSPFDHQRMALANQFYLHRKNMPQTLHNKAALWWALAGTLPLNVGKVVQTRDPGYLTGFVVGAWEQARGRGLIDPGGGALRRGRSARTHRSSSSVTTARERPSSASCSTAAPRRRFRRSRCSCSTSRPFGGGEGWTTPRRRPASSPKSGATPRVRLWGLRRRAALGSRGPLPRGGVPLRRRGALPGLRAPRGEGAVRRQDARLPECGRRAAGGVARRPGCGARPRREGGRALDRRAPVRPQQPVRGRGLVGAGHPDRARGRAAPPGAGADRALRGSRHRAGSDGQARLCDHVRLGYNSEMLAIERAAPDKIVAEQADWYTGVSKPISAAESERWRTEMPEADQRVVASVAGPELRELGYEVGADELAVPRSRALAYTAHDSGAARRSRLPPARPAGARPRAPLRRQAQAGRSPRMTNRPGAARRQARARPGCGRSGSSPSARSTRPSR